MDWAVRPIRRSILSRSSTDKGASLKSGGIFFGRPLWHRFAYGRPGSKGQLANGVTTLAGFFSRNRSHPIDRRTNG
jgi:hypothetical protein